MPPRPANIAIVGAGPAGIFTADILTHQPIPSRVDLFERLPAPFGLVRYGVAPDHPRIRAITDSLHNVLDRGDIRLVAGIDIGTDLPLNDLRNAYDAVVLTTGANDDAPLPIPGIDLPGSFGASEFVAWYDAHPDAVLDWPLDHAQVAVIGAGNVALDIIRMLAKPADDLLATDIPDHVHRGLRASRVTDIHLFARRGPAEAQFSAMELRELAETRDVDVVIDPADMTYADSSHALLESSLQRRLVNGILQEWAGRDRATFTAPRRVHLHFMHAPVRVDGSGHVKQLTVERTRHRPDGTVDGTGHLRHFSVGQIYRAVGYASTPISGAPFDPDRRRIPNDQGRVLDTDGQTIPGLYVSGWIKRGPIGLIGSTKSDSQQTVTNLVHDLTSRHIDGDDDPLPGLLDRSGLTSIDWGGWLRIDSHEKALGTASGRSRVKVFDRNQLAAIARNDRAIA